MEFFISLFKTPSMKKLLYSLLFLLFVISCKPINTKTDIKENELSGKVKSLIYYKYRMYHRSWEKDFLPRETLFFNEKGFLVKEEGFDSYGEVNGEILYTYDDKDYLMNLRSKFDNNNEYMEDYTYNSKGSLIKKVERNHSQYQDVTTYLLSYDNFGNLIEEIEQGIDETWIEKHIYKYSNRNLILEDKEYHNGKYESLHSYDYNIEGACIKETTKFIDSYIDFTTQIFDYKGNKVESTVYTNEKIERHEKLDYDLNNNLIKMVHRAIDYSYSNEWVYSYDKHRNWITKDSYFNGELIAKYKREIEYYE